MSNTFLLPDLGEGLTEASIVSWLVAEGDEIAIDQPVIEVESAKAVVELPSPYAGIVEKLHGAVGDIIELGKPVISVASADGGAAPASSAPVADESAFEASAAPTPDDSAEHGGSGAVLVGYGTTADTTRLKRPEGGRFGKGRAAAAAASAHSAPAAETAPAAGAALLDESRRSRVVSPLVRRLALDNGFDASHLVGSDGDGVVRREHVEAAISARSGAGAGQAAAAAAPVAGSTAAAAPSAGAGADAPGVERIPLTGLRAVVAERLSASRREIPEATIWLEVDATETVALRRRLQEETGERFSFAAIVGRFALAALRKYPILNSTMSADGREILRHEAVNLGIAAQTERGLVVPVIHGAQALSLRGLRDAIDDIAQNHADGVFPTSRLVGGTFTLNNYGGFGVDGSAPILNAPEVAMLGIGRMMDKPWIVDGEIAVRRIVTLTFVFDHRVCDGDVASGFLTTVARAIESPTSAFADL